MAKDLVIVHGWSDSSSGFKDVIEFLVKHNFYQRENIKAIDYKSLDDQAYLADFADKFDEFYQKNFFDKRIDIICHSTGSLVVRYWLALRRTRQRRRGPNVDLPVERFFMFAPANFGSDLARLGQSGLNRLRTGLQIELNDDVGVDTFEVGKRVLQSLEPASPDQWKLSNIDLYQETYFGDGDKSKQMCYPFVFAAGNPKQNFFKLSDSLGKFVSRVIPIIDNPSTDSTVRICGTSLNTRKVIIRQTKDNVKRGDFEWVKEQKFLDIPHAIFPQYNHGEVIKKGLTENELDKEVSELFQAAWEVDNPVSYAKVAEKFRDFTVAKYSDSKNTGNKKRFQQFFFKIQDDVDFDVIDFYVDFIIYKNDKYDEGLTNDCEKQFDSGENWYGHSVDQSCRVLLIDYDQLCEFFQKVRDEGATVMLQITAKSISDEIRFARFNCPIFGSGVTDGDFTFLYPNTTTLVEIILDREQDSTILELRDTQT